MRFVFLLVCCSVFTEPPTVEVSHPAVEDVPEPVWPEAGAPLRAINPVAHPLDRPIRVYLDPGHGTGTNTGNRGARCQDEEVTTLELVDDLKQRLTALGGFEVRSGRPAGVRSTYAQRVEEANAWQADVLLSIHTDARGELESWSPIPGWPCHRSDGSEGFAILVSDEGAEELASSRASLAAALATQMQRAGFPPYDGVDYGDLYDTGAEPGSFLDRRGLLMLRRPQMPSVIIEVHHAYNLEEVRRWDEQATREAFALAAATALRVHQIDLNRALQNSPD